MNKSKHPAIQHYEESSVIWQWLETPLGLVLAKWGYPDTSINRTDAQDETLYLLGLWFKDQKHFPKNAPLSSSVTVNDGSKQVDCPQILFDLEQWLSAYFLGDPKAWDLLCTIPLKPKGSDFQNRVWALLVQIPYGQTRTYGQLAKDIALTLNKTSFSAQAVGGAVGRNPISILIPCHRIVGAKGALTGYAGGLNKKAHLLRLENAIPPSA